jgi:hypothetical protein
MKDKRYEFNMHLNQEDRDVIDSLMRQNIKISGLFKTFIREYLKHIENKNNEFYTNIQNKT